GLPDVAPGLIVHDAAPGLETRDPAGREHTEGVVIVVQRQPDLLEIVSALDAPRRLAGRLHRRQEQADPDGDDPDRHEELDQREATPRRSRLREDHWNLLTTSHEREVDTSPALRSRGS